VTFPEIRKDPMILAHRIAQVIPGSVRDRLVPLLQPLVRAWEKQRLSRLYGSILTPGDAVFDIGAHTGAMAEVLLQAGARVVCVDPQPACVAALKQKFGHRRDVQIEPVGVGAQAGQLEFSICREGPAMSTFSEKWKAGRFASAQWNEKVLVPIVTLDSLIAKHGVPRFCKIDVEGFETEVLKGLSQPLRMLSFEFTREFLSDALTCMRHLETLGRTLFQVSLGSTFRWALPAWVESAELMRYLEARPEPDLWGDIYARTDLAAR
jgi:FkbM family methyltransferase